MKGLCVGNHLNYKTFCVSFGLQRSYFYLDYTRPLDEPPSDHWSLNDLGPWALIVPEEFIKW